MRILTYPVNLEIGGSALNAIDLADAMRTRGHEVLFFSQSGPLGALLADRGIRLITADVPPRPRPSPKAIGALWHVVRRERIDLVHTYEYWTCLEAYFGAHLAAGVPHVASVMSMGVPAYLPGSIPLIVGTRSLQEDSRRRRRGMVELLEPPVNPADDHPSVDASAFLHQYGLEDGGSNIVVVSRISPDLKLEGLDRAIDAAGLLAERKNVRLIIVGGGSAFHGLLARAEAMNARLGRTVIVLTGPMLDPRPAYAGADIVLGMGSSVLRGMAFEKPAIVLGEDGFSEVVGPDTVDRFLRDGFFGRGVHHGAAPLDRQIERLVQTQPLRDRLGRFGRSLVCERFSLDAAASVLDAVYLRAITQRQPVVRLIPEAVQVAMRAVGHKIRDRRTHMLSTRKAAA